MAKAPTNRTMVNANRAVLVLPDGTEIPPGGKIDLTKDLEANAGVMAWVEGGQLRPFAPDAAPQASADLAAANAALADMTAQRDALIAEKDVRDAAMAALQEAHDKLAADLEAATAPKA